MVEKLNFNCILQKNILDWRVLLSVKGCNAGTVAPIAFGGIGALTVKLKLKGIVAENFNMWYTFSYAFALPNRSYHMSGFPSMWVLKPFNCWTIYLLQYSSYTSLALVTVSEIPCELVEANDKSPIDFAGTRTLLCLCSKIYTDSHKRKKGLTSFHPLLLIKKKYICWLITKSLDCKHQPHDLQRGEGIAVVY